MARTDNLTDFLTDVANAIKTKKEDGAPIPAKDFDTEIINLPSGGGIAPRNVQNLQVKLEPTSVGLKWDDPEDTPDHEEGIYCSWAGTKVIKREGDEIPLNEEDGELVEDITERNKYQNDYLMVNDLVTDKQYSFALFPYSDKEVYNVNEVNCLSATPTAVDFATATDEQIATILDAHYRGLLDVSDYWKVGDTRTIHLNTMSGGSGGETHVAQDMTFVIIGINHDDLKEQVGTRTKAAITLQCREILGNKGTAETGQNYGGSGQYSNNPRRTWLNNTFIGSLPEELKNIAKTVIKKNLANHTDSTAGNATEDKAFLLSCSEVGLTYSYYKGNATLEGAKYEYFASNTQRIKKINNNGLAAGSGQTWWLRSPSSDGSEYWMGVYESGSAYINYSNYTFGIAPAFCL